MSPIKRSTSPVTETAPPAKKAKAANDFPLFDDGDVTICMGNLIMKLHSKTLRGSCEYFANFEELPTRFVLKPNTASYAESYILVPATSDGNGVSDNEAQKDNFEDALTVNENIFRLLYHKPISCTTQTPFSEITALAKVYGCIDAIRDDLITALLRVSLGSQMFRDGPDRLLYTGYYLRDKAIFTEALVHTVGQRKCDSEYIPGNVKGLVTKCVAELEDKVGQCWEAAIRCCEADTISNAVAATLLRQYLDKRIPCILGSPLRTEVYNVFAALHRMEDVKVLLEIDLMTQVDTIDDALGAGVSFLRSFDADRLFEIEPSGDTQRSINKGLDCGVSRDEVVEELSDILKQVQYSIKPLFKGDRNVGYFTCFQFEGPFPWESLTDSSGNGAHPQMLCSDQPRFATV
ncbi:hypothetical protein DIS24_g494 [Lasiodiplodia hormozganensis]|uniref:BTB domain-containing protein n=1 Tax=Lasiodiplodia hormozganensis TaxID=869390 RepID=A0AA39Z4X2_9PEZI|nr:hypothetical protein DIS24_g494 [Lasiodiplodia hormozganensis]